MRFAYEIKNGCAVVRRCYDFGKEAEIPSEIDGCPVTELGAYAFSAHLGREQFALELKSKAVKIWNFETKEQEAEEPSPEAAPELQGIQVERVSLPEGLRKIGAYAFYNCNALSELHFHRKSLSRPADGEAGRDRDFLPEGDSDRGAGENGRDRGGTVSGEAPVPGIFRGERGEYPGPHPDDPYARQRHEFPQQLLYEETGFPGLRRLLLHGEGGRRF